VINTTKFAGAKGPAQDNRPEAPVVPSVTVMVINLFFSNPDLNPHKGFGYLIPRSIPFEQNPERALGVIFDSDANIGQNADEPKGTKFTIMMGGHWWNGWEKEDYPTDEEAVTMARSLLARHLGILDKPVATNATLQKDCIPQYPVGFQKLLEKKRQDLAHTFHHRLAVAGSWYKGVGLNDCVDDALRTVASIVYFPYYEGGSTGLEGGFGWEQTKTQQGLIKRNAIADARSFGNTMHPESPLFWEDVAAFYSNARNLSLAEREAYIDELRAVYKREKR
jgi:hypothetical protein